jgi:alkylation response protein AidB-like acyl-CoA dehydrogenase
MRKPDTFADIVDNARALGDALGARSDEIERRGQLPPDVVEDLIESGVFRMSMPADWGGPELSPMQQVAVLEEIARGDTSAAWCAMTGSDSGVYVGFLEDVAARNLFPHLDTIAGGSVASVGRADEIDGALRISGQWPHCSGVTHADVIAAGCVVFKNGTPAVDSRGRPEIRIAMAPLSHWRVESNWHATGLAGTGSHDMTPLSKYLVVPESHTFSLEMPTRAGPAWHGRETLFRKLPGVPLGAARGVIDHVTRLIEGEDGGIPIPLQDVSDIKRSLADAEMQLGSARAYVYSVLDDQWQQLSEGRALSSRARAAAWLSRLNAFQMYRSVARLLYDGLRRVDRGPVDRALRDAETLCQHIAGHRRSLDQAAGLLLDHTMTSPPAGR